MKFLKDRHLALLPSVLLCLVAANQMYLAHAHQLNPWKGGGFGMFSSTDHIAFRPVRVWLVEDDHERRADLSAWNHRDAFQRLRSLPGSRYARDLAHLIAARNWYAVDTPADGHPPHARLIALPEHAAHDPLDFHAVRIQVHRLVYDHETLTVRPRLLREHRIEVTR